MIRQALFTMILLTGAASGQTWRPSVMARHWAVASGHPLSSMAAAKMLEQGGNAVDAAVAATFAMGLVEPSNVGIGGHGMVMIYLARTGQVYCIDGSGWSGKNARLDRFDPKQGGLPFHGPLAPVVPGLVSALFKASHKYGKLPWAKLLDPAISLAAEGFPLTPLVAPYLQNRRKEFGLYPSTQKVWWRNGEPLRAGDLVREPELAETLRLLARGGNDAYYRGPIAKRIVAFLNQNGGLLEETDFAEYQAREGPALHTSSRGYELYEGPQWSFDHIGTETLNILEGFDLKRMGHLSADFVHHVTEAMKLAFADRDRSVSYPRFPDQMPLLLSKEFARQRRGLIQPGRVLDPAPAGQTGSSGQTTYVGVIDAERNMVSITSSISGDFGNMLVVDGPGGGFFLNNWMPLFKLDPNDANRLEPRKVPRTGWSPMLALKDGKPFAAFGTPGGDTIPQAQLLFFIHLVDFGMEVQEALEQPWFRTESFKAYRYPNAIGKNLVVSERMPAGVRSELVRRGHTLATHKSLGIGNVRAVVIDPRSGRLSAGAASGFDAYALGW